MAPDRNRLALPSILLASCVATLGKLSSPNGNAPYGKPLADDSAVFGVLAYKKGFAGFRGPGGIRERLQQTSPLTLSAKF